MHCKDWLCEHHNVLKLHFDRNKFTKKSWYIESQSETPKFCLLYLVLYNGSLLIWCIDLFIDLRSQHSQRGHNYALIIVLDCACNTQGTIQADERCNDNGLCNCKSTVRGDKCTQCAPHYYGLDSLGDCYRRLLSYLYLQCLPLSHCLLLFYWFCCGLYLVFLLISVWLDM